MKRNLVQELLLYKYRYKIAYILIFTIPIVLLILQLGYLTPSFNELEASSGLISQNISSLADNPLNFPYKLLQLASIQLFGHTAFALRLPSALFGLLTLGLLYWLLRYWHRIRIAILGTLFVVISSWFLHFSRFGTPAIMLATMLLALLLASTWFHHNKAKRGRAFLLLIVVVAIALYTPLMIYFIAVLAIAHQKLIRNHLKSIDTWKIAIALIIGLFIFAPLIIASINDSAVLRELFGIPESLPTIAEFLKNVVESFARIFWRSPEFAPLNLGTLALLDIFTATMTALGLYHYEKHFDQHRTRILVIGFFVLLAAISISQNPQYSIVLLPFIYIFAATGIITLLNQWNDIFPKNPFARTMAIIPIALVILTAGYYHVNRYFVAWARSPETKRVFTSDPELLGHSLQQLDAGSRAIVVTNNDETRLSFVAMDVEPQIDFVAADEVINVQLADYDYLYLTNSIRLPQSLKASLPEVSHYIANERSVDSIAFVVYQP